ncbi:MAG: COX15/CtaA family protein [Hyphomicrobium sp.]|jgi:cytochrome c oxidase assembly protein subunit 15
MALAATDPDVKTGTAYWDGAVRAWLFTIAGLVLAMVTVGGATRLTDSGLSITEWKPLLGAIPPLTEADWLAAFERYKQIPEYSLVNKGMNLDAFQVIYWWEWSHRFLGRMIGLAFALPLAFFWVKGVLRPGYALKLAGVLALGALQGAIGWFMVQSGLVDRIDVSQYRLALHLTVAFLILSLVVWLGLSLGKSERAPLVPEKAVRMTANALLALAFVQVVLGAFVAGLKGGLLYNTWPDMNGKLVPDDILALTPWYANIFENPATAQFDHRLVAYVLVALAAAHVWSIFSRPRAAIVKGSAALLMAGILAQVVLGITTLLNAVPVGLGIAHQAAAAVLLVLVTRHVHITQRGH